MSLRMSSKSAISQCRVLEVAGFQLKYKRSLAKGEGARYIELELHHAGEAARRRSSVSDSAFAAGFEALVRAHAMQPGGPVLVFSEHHAVPRVIVNSTALLHAVPGGGDGSATLPHILARIQPCSIRVSEVPAGELPDPSLFWSFHCEAGAPTIGAGRWSKARPKPTAVVSYDGHVLTTHDGQAFQYLETEDTPARWMVEGSPATGYTFTITPTYGHDKAPLTLGLSTFQHREEVAALRAGSRGVERWDVVTAAGVPYTGDAAAGPFLIRSRSNPALHLAGHVKRKALPVDALTWEGYDAAAVVGAEALSVDLPDVAVAAPPPGTTLLFHPSFPLVGFVLADGVGVGGTLEAMAAWKASLDLGAGVNVVAWLSSDALAATRFWSEHPDVRGHVFIPDVERFVALLPTEERAAWVTAFCDPTRGNKHPLC